MFSPRPALCIAGSARGQIMARKRDDRSKKQLSEKAGEQPLAPTAGQARRVRGRAREGAAFPVAPPRMELPGDYAETLAEIRRRIQEERLRTVLAANSEM